MGGATMGVRVFSMVSAIILARLLDPVDFGVVALAQIILSTMGLFSGLGMGLAVIQSPYDREKVAYQAFVVSALSGFAFYLVLIIFAPFFAELLNRPQVVDVLRWMSAIVLLAALTSVPEALLQKELLFGRVSTSVIVSEFTYIAAAITFAVMGYGLWSLVYGALARSVVNLVMMWTLCPGWAWITRKPWDKPLMKSLLGFGIQASGSGVVAFLNSILDSYIVGRVLGEIAIGIYDRANNFSSRIVEGFVNVIGVVLFPSYSRIQNDKERLSNAYLKSLRLMSFFTVPVAMGMFIVAEEMIPTLMGAKWLAMVAPFQILAFVSLVKPLSGTTGALFASTGYPRYNIRSGLCITGVMLAGIYFLLGYGVSGVACAVLIAHVVGFAFNMYQVHRLLPGAAWKMLNAIAPATFAALIMIMAILLIKQPLFRFAGDAVTIPTLAVMICVGAAVYLTALIMTQRPLLSEILGLTLSHLRLKQVQH